MQSKCPGKGEVRVIESGGGDARVYSAANAWMHSYGHIVARCVGHGDDRYRLRYFYVEYENVASPGDTAASTAVEQDDTVAHYAALAASATRDFIRVRVLLPDIRLAAGSPAGLPEELGNELLFVGTTAGVTQGVHGKPFSAAANSRISGIGLAAAPDPEDWTRDVLFGRANYAPSDQPQLVAGKNYDLSYKLSFLA